MLPTNSGKAKSQGCNPVSSNCVVWQGPDLGCIGICKGDTISDVVNKLAIELCALIEMFDLSEYDFACLSIPVSQTPRNIQELLQILTYRVCALEGGTITASASRTSSISSSDSTVVSIAPCFQYIDPKGDLVITMPLNDYVNTIGNKICNLVDDINILQLDVTTLQEQMSATQILVTNLEESKAGKTSLDYQVNTKTDPSAGTKYITQALRYIENSLISTQDALGSQTEQYQNIIKAGLIYQEAKLFGIGNMASINGWISNPTKTAQSIGNIWLAIADIRDAVQYIQENCCSTGCTDIYLNFRASINVGPTTILTIFTDGSTGFTPDWRECTGNTRITVKDSAGNSSTFSTSLIALINNPSGYQIDITSTSIDPTLDLTITTDSCFINTATDTTCEKCYEYTIYAQADCPTTILTVYTTSVGYQFTATPGYSYIVNVYYATGSTPVASQIITTPGTIIISTIPGLLSATNYELEVVVVNTSGTETPCVRQPFTTLADNCQPPINAVAILTT